MKHTAIVIAAGLALAATLSSAKALAQSFDQTFVSGLGSDSNPCTRTQPCLTFQRAHDNTIAGGEVDVLDPGGYGPLTISKSISIVNDGAGTAGLRAPPSPGVAITINAGPNDSVYLRGLTIEGTGVGGYGVKFNSGFYLTVENCVIRHFKIDGIIFQPNATSNLLVSNTLVTDNADHGIVVAPTGGGAVTAVFNRVVANNNVGVGIFVSGNSSTGSVIATVTDSVAAQNRAVGFAVQATGAPTEMMLFRSVASNNGDGINGAGISASNNGKIRIGQSVVTGNTNGWQVGGGGVVQSYGDNKINGNGIASSELAPPAIANK